MLDLSYCGQVVKEKDPDRFLISLFAPEHVRGALWALFAFNHEIAKIRESVSEPQLGHIRLQWWRDAIAAIYEQDAEIPRHKGVIALEEAIKAHDLPRAEFDALIEARTLDMEDETPANLEALAAYAEMTSAPLFSLALRICGDDPAKDLMSEPLQVVAVNYALAGLLRAVPWHAKQKRCYLPRDLLAEHNIRTHMLFEGKPQEALSEVVSAVATLSVAGVRPQNRVLKAAQALAELHIKRLRNIDNDVLCPQWVRPLPFRELRVWWRVMTL